MRAFFLVRYFRIRVKFLGFFSISKEFVVFLRGFFSFVVYYYVVLGLVL